MSHIQALLKTIHHHYPLAHVGTSSDCSR